MISLNEAIERQVWVKDYHSTSFMDTINESQQEEQEEIEEQEEEYQE